MVLDSASQIGNYLGGIFKEQNSVDLNISPEDGEFVNTVYDENEMFIGGKVQGYKLIFDSEAFIIDHPVQGELDSAVYKIDSGYRNATDVYFELSYPIYWDMGYKELIFEQSLT
jgi:hypothetical protein